MRVTNANEEILAFFLYRKNNNLWRTGMRNIKINFWSYYVYVDDRASI